MQVKERDMAIQIANTSRGSVILMDSNEAAKALFCSNDASKANMALLLRLLPWVDKYVTTATIPVSLVRGAPTKKDWDPVEMGGGAAPPRADPAGRYRRARQRLERVRH